MGVYDFIKSVLTDLKVNVHFHKVAIRPGKPLLFASHGSTTIFSVPGNPISTAVAMRFFIDPYLRMIQMQNPESPLRLPLSNPIKKPEGLTCFYKAKIENCEKESVVTQVNASLDQGSAVISSFMQTEYWVSLQADKSFYDVNEIVDVFPMF
jgi:molybdopterin molybdotransferase